MIQIEISRQCCNHLFLDVYLKQPFVFYTRNVSGILGQVVRRTVVLPIVYTYQTLNRHKKIVVHSPDI